MPKYNHPRMEKITRRQVMNRVGKTIKGLQSFLKKVPRFSETMPTARYLAATGQAGKLKDLLDKKDGDE